MSKETKSQFRYDLTSPASYEAKPQTQTDSDQSLQDQNLQDIVQLARYICDAPIALVTRADEKELSFIAKIGIPGRSVAIKESFCVHAMEAPDTVMVVPDARLDQRFKDNPMVLGEQGYIFYAGSPLVSPEGEVIGTICVFDYVAKQLNQKQIESLQALSRQVIAMLELKKLSEQLHQTSMTDALTGVHNRRAFDQRLESEFSRWLRTGQSFVLALIDVDHFKSFNDSFGHAAGDQALSQVAALFQQNSRNYDFFARYGGEEFALILSGADLVSAYKKLEKLRQLIASHPWSLRPLTVSIGLAAAENLTQKKQLLEAADLALYKAKNLGRNQSCIFSSH
jgi:diguanylate cyclase (GGDEF)-like protein